MLYTTNTIESLNSVIRHAFKKRKVFPTDDSVKKVVWLAIQAASQKWTMSLKDWRMAMSRFIIEFSDRFDDHFQERLCQYDAPLTLTKHLYHCSSISQISLSSPVINSILKSLTPTFSASRA